MQGLAQRKGVAGAAVVVIPCQWYTSQQEHAGVRLLLEVLRGEAEHRASFLQSLPALVWKVLGGSSKGRH